MKLSDIQFKALVIFLALIAVGVITKLRFFDDFDLPTKPSRPTVLANDPRDVSRQVEGSTDAFELHIKEDAAGFKLGRVGVAEMERSFPYKEDSERRVLAIGETAESLNLKLSLTKVTVKGARSPQMMLSIENQSSQALAYKITTTLSSGEVSCSSMAHPAHNGIAILPGESTSRSECDYKSGRTLIITNIETVELPLLGFHYLSSLRVDEMFGTKRVAGHKVPRGSLDCDGLQSTRHKMAIEQGDILWHDFVDFYARHRCSTYAFFEGYKAFQGDGEQILPVLPSDP